MKILILTSQPYPYMSGGTSRKLLSQSKYLQKNDHEVMMINGKPTKKTLYMNEASDYAKIHNVGLPYIPLGKSNFKLLFILFYWVFVQLAYYISAFFLARKHIKEIDLIEVNGIYSEGLLAVTLKKLYKVPIVYVHSGSYSTKRKKIFKMMKRGKFFVKISNTMMNILEKFIYSNCDGIFTGDDVEDYYRNLKFSGIYKSLVNGTDTEIFKSKDYTDFKKELGFENKKIISYIGRLATVKNIPVIINAFNKLRETEKDVVLLIVGGGLEEEKLKSLVKESKFGSDIHFYGMQKDVLPYYNISDIVVIASKYEGICFSVIEAMACERIVVSSAVGLIPNVITDGLNGFLVHGKETDEGIEIDAENLSNKLNIALHSNNLIGKTARNIIEKDYSWNTIIIKYINLYKQIITSKEKIAR